MTAGIKRAFDFVLAIAGLLVLSPVLFLIYILVLVFDGRPGIFVQTRVGRRGRLFSLYKFRTMRPDNRELLVTSRDDQRVTTLGQHLRRYKLDELPQLLNVLKGEMSFVGPRPEVPKFVELFKAEYETILTIRPGVTDLASIIFKDESALLNAGGRDSEREYIDKVLPIKIRHNLEYVKKHGFFTDLSLIIKTVAAMVRRSGSTENPSAGL
ncbi:MAG: sugar transferase [Actinomycetota bacterium]|nr:sugar transferase [Actinomycetota bacterium]